MATLSQLSKRLVFSRRTSLGLWVASALTLLGLGAFAGLVTLFAVAVAGPGWDGLGTMLIIFALAVPIGLALAVVLIRLSGQVFNQTLPWLYATATVIVTIVSLLAISSVANMFYPIDPTAAVDVSYIIGAWVLPVILTRVWLDVAYRLFDRRTHQQTVDMSYQ